MRGLKKKCKGQMLRKFIWYPKSIFRFIQPFMCISKQIKWIRKNTVKFFRHKKRCWMSKRIYCLFQCSRNYLWMVTSGLFFLISFLRPQPLVTYIIRFFLDLCFSNYIMAGNFVWLFSFWMITQFVDESHLFLEMVKVSIWIKV